MPRRKKIQNPVPHSKTDDRLYIELGTAGRIVIPKAIREEMKWKEGDEVRIRTRRGRVIVSTPDGDAAFAKDELRKLSDDGD